MTEKKEEKILLNSKIDIKTKSTIGHFLNIKIPKLTSGSIEFLKIFGIIFMIVDHYASIFLTLNNDEYILLRSLGRFVYPVFSFLLVYNYIFNTSNKVKYIKRLLIFGIISQPFYHFALSKNAGLYAFKAFNIFIDLSIALIFIYIVEKIISIIKNSNRIESLRDKIFISISLATLSIPIMILFYTSSKTAYPLLGIFLTFSFYLFIKSLNLNLKSIKVSHYLKILSSVFLLFMLYVINFSPDYNFHYYTITSLFFIIIAFVVKFKIPRINKWFFYLFYPLHLFLLTIIFFSL